MFLVLQIGRFLLFVLGHKKSIERASANKKINCTLQEEKEKNIKEKIKRKEKDIKKEEIM